MVVAARCRRRSGRVAEDVGTRGCELGEEVVDPVWNRRLPELSCAANAVSLLMPHVEPYVVRSTRAALPLLEPDLRRAAEGYLRQEAAHHRQHRRFNDALAGRYRGVPALDRAMARTYRWLERRGGIRFGVAFAAGFETVAFATARWVDRRLPDLLDGAEPEAAALYLWHLAEEVEHKCVAHDVHRALGTSRPVHALAMVVSLQLMALFTIAGTVLMLAAEGRLWRPASWFRLVGWSVGYAFEVLPAMAVTLLPGHHPSHLADPAWLTLHLEHLRAHGTAGTGTAPVASGPVLERFARRVDGPPVRIPAGHGVDDHRRRVPPGQS
jgi:uncharacterized protein